MWQVQKEKDQRVHLRNQFYDNMDIKLDFLGIKK